MYFIRPPTLIEGKIYAYIPRNKLRKYLKVEDTFHVKVLLKAIVNNKARVTTEEQTRLETDLDLLFIQSPFRMGKIIKHFNFMAKNNNNGAAKKFSIMIDRLYILSTVIGFYNEKIEEISKIQSGSLKATREEDPWLLEILAMKAELLSYAKELIARGNYVDNEIQEHFVWEEPIEGSKGETESVDALGFLETFWNLSDKMVAEEKPELEFTGFSCNLVGMVLIHALNQEPDIMGATALVLGANPVLDFTNTFLYGGIVEGLDFKIDGFYSNLAKGGK